MCDCDCERPKAYSESHPVARKTHLCCECGKSILPGERYHVFSGIYDFGCETYKTCESCEAMRAAYEKETGECVCFTGLREALCETGRHDWWQPNTKGGR